LKGLENSNYEHFAISFSRSGVGMLDSNFERHSQLALNHWESTGSIVKLQLVMHFSNAVHVQGLLTAEELSIEIQSLISERPTAMAEKCLPLLSIVAVFEDCEFDF
jgi:hypothetical protein